MTSKKEKEKCPTCGRSFVYLNRHKCKRTGEREKRQIRKFDLRRKDLHDLSTIPKLKNHPEIEELDLEFNYIKEIKGISHLKNLKKLNLSQNGISKIKGLGKLVKLEVLEIAHPQKYYEEDSMYGHSDIADRDYFEPLKKIEGLDKLINLKELDLSSNEIDNISGLKNLLKLRKLILSGNKIDNFEVLQHLSDLEELALGNNMIEALPYAIAKHLKKLKFCDLPVSSVIKEIRLNDFIKLSLIYHDMSKIAYYEYTRWKYQNEKTRKSWSCHIAVIYVNEKKFQRTCPDIWQKRRITHGGLRLESEKDFDDYCNEIRRWTENDYAGKLLPETLTCPLLVTLMNEGDNKAEPALIETIKSGLLSRDDQIMFFLSEDEKEYLKYLPAKECAFLIKELEKSPIMPQTAIPLSKLETRNKYAFIRKMEQDKHNLERIFKEETGCESRKNKRYTNKYTDWRYDFVQRTARLIMILRSLRLKL